MAIDELSRRSALRAFGRAGAGAAIGTAVLPRRAGAVNKISKTKAVAFALIGDENHNSDYIRSALGSTLVEAAQLPIDFTDEEKLLSYDNLKHYKILIIFRDGLRFPGGYWYAQNWNPKPGQA